MDIADFIEEHSDAIKTATTVFSFTAIVPSLVLALPLVAAAANMRAYLPAATALLGFLFQFFYLCVGSLYMVLYLALSITCNDIDRPLLRFGGGEGEGIGGVSEEAVGPSAAPPARLAQLPHHHIISTINNKSNSNSHPSALSEQTDSDSVRKEGGIGAEESTANSKYHSFMEWLVVPYCEATTPFEDIKRNVGQMERRTSAGGCERLLEFCNDRPLYKATGDGVETIYFCNFTDPHAVCKSVEDVRAVMAMHVKAGVPPSEACAGTDPSIPNTECTVEKCASHCKNPIAAARSAEALRELRSGVRVLDVYTSRILPWLDCRRLISHVVGIGVSSTCGSARAAAGLLRDGALMIGFGCVIAVVLALLGQKRFFPPALAGRSAAGGYTFLGDADDQKDEEEESLYDDVQKKDAALITDSPAVPYSPSV